MRNARLNIGIAVAAIAAAAHGVSEASFTPFVSRTAWRAAVGGPTILRDPSDYYSASGQTVNPEIWADVGVHLLSSGTIFTGPSGSSGIVFGTSVGSTFQVKWDYQITALWFEFASPTGSISFFQGSTLLGSLGDGSYGVTSTTPFDRVSISNGSAGVSALIEIEWGPVPGPGAGMVLGCGAAATIGHRRRRK